MKIILHNEHYKASRDFKAAYENDPGVSMVVDFNDEKQRDNYLSVYKKNPSSFPSIIDEETRLMVREPSSLADLDQLILEHKKHKMDKDIEMLISSTKKIQERHKDQLEMGDPTTITAAKYNEWMQYWKSLRDLSKDPNYPNVPLPTKPS